MHTPTMCVCSPADPVLYWSVMHGEGDEKDTLLQTARTAAAAAGARVMDLYGRQYHIEKKNDRSLVTQADYEADSIIATHLTQTGIPILSEEAEDSVAARRGVRHVWVVDPLDGTKDFVEHTGDFAIMIGLLEDDQPILGVIALPATGELVYAVSGRGAYLVSGAKTQQIQVSGHSRVQEATVVVSRSHFTPHTQRLLSPFLRSNVRRAGSNGVKIGLIARGAADIFFNPSGKLGEWDLCAPQVILEAAGGTMTRLNGERLRFNKEKPYMPGGVLATNGALHDTVTDALRVVIADE